MVASINILSYLILGYFMVPVCAQPTGHRKRSATPRLFPPPRGHPTDLSFLSDFAEGCTVFQLSKSERFPWPRRNVNAYISFKHTRQGARPSDRRFAVVFTNPLHVFQFLKVPTMQRLRKIRSFFRGFQVFCRSRSACAHLRWSRE